MITDKPPRSDIMKALELLRSWFCWHDWHMTYYPSTSKYYTHKICVKCYKLKPLNILKDWKLSPCGGEKQITARMLIYMTRVFFLLASLSCSVLGLQSYFVGSPFFNFYFLAAILLSLGIFA